MFQNISLFLNEKTANLELEDLNTPRATSSSDSVFNEISSVPVYFKKRQKYSTHH